MAIEGELVCASVSLAWLPSIDLQSPFLRLYEVRKVRSDVIKSGPVLDEDMRCLHFSLAVVLSNRSVLYCMLRNHGFKHYCMKCDDDSGYKDRGL